MNLSLTDFASLSPLIVLLLGALALLLFASFQNKNEKQGSFIITLLTLVLALACTFKTPVSQNSLLTDWLSYDFLNQFFTPFFLFIGLATTLIAYPFFKKFEVSTSEFYFFLLSCIFGLILIGASTDFLTLFLGLETLSIALYILCGYIKKWEMSKESAIKYFFTGSIATAFLIYGIALIYGSVGSTNFGVIQTQFHQLTHQFDKILFLAGIGFVTIGLAFKAALVPFHSWAPDVYDGAPTPVTAFMAVGTKVGAFAAFARLFLIALPDFDPLWTQALTFIAVLTMVYANILALRQIHLRRFFAYSGISHAGFLLIPIIVASDQSLSALLFYLVIYSLATLGAFACLTVWDHQSKGVSLNDLQGAFSRSPFLASVFTLCLLTLAGIPPTAGFFAKFYLFKIAFQGGYYLLVIVGLLTAIFSAFYYLRIVSTLFSDTHQEAPFFPSRSASLVALIVFASLLIFSFYPEPLIAMIQKFY